jgi:hypothetical protein
LAATTVAIVRTLIAAIFTRIAIVRTFIAAILTRVANFVHSTCISIIRAKALIAITRALSVALVKSAEVMTVMYVLIV